MPRPIEMHAHDPRRYLGDMLAWVHQSLASERELLTALFGTDDLGSPAPHQGQACTNPRPLCSPQQRLTEAAKPARHAS